MSGWDYTKLILPKRKEMIKIKELIDSYRDRQQLLSQTVAAWNYACHALFSQHSRTRGALSLSGSPLCVSGSRLFPFHIQRKPIWNHQSVSL